MRRHKAQKLYEQALSEARAHAGAQCTGEEGQAFGKEGSRECSPFDPRDYKIADLPSKATLPAFMKKTHDLDFLLETFGMSRKEVTRLLQASRLYTDKLTKDAPDEVKALKAKTKTKPGDPPLEFGFAIVSKADAL